MYPEGSEVMVRRQLIIRVWFVSLLLVALGSLLPRHMKYENQTVPVAGIVEYTTGCSDKVEHFVAYYLLAILPALCVRRTVFGFLAGGLMSVYGVVLEYAQTLTPDRTFDYADMKMNAAGVLCGLITAALVLVIPSIFRKPDEEQMHSNTESGSSVIKTGRSEPHRQ